MLACQQWESLLARYSTSNPESYHSDIDECTSSVPLCDVNATCTNNDGSYIFTCKNGFSGDGKTCKGRKSCFPDQFLMKIWPGFGFFCDTKRTFLIAPCKVIPIPESVKFLLVESEILGFGIRNTAQGIRNVTDDWNSESRFHWQRLESSIWNPESTTWNPESKTRLSWILLYGAILQVISVISMAEFAFARLELP